MFSYRVFCLAALSKGITRSSTTFLTRTNVLNKPQSCGYAKKVVAKGKGKGMVKEELKGPEVCKDPIRLTSHAVGVNIFKQGEDPKIKPTEEYPEWLFDLNLGEAKKLDELEPDSWDYWNRLRKENILRYNKLHKGKKF
ncbi:39S ribosomal protein L54, mitochondrial [Oryzias melastigma]|uniref:Large ribosomal subunit protein mL54 n=1 Tax=Oryzias melastigma TaxID=30732 RepID=A0A3B3BS60_ORYME|nr:39S ribosomal protein L54, mitochondrial [Oryzias melastigma]KAF6721422.1 39S ribosomal protein L54, mitochondrial [Oryzias melastigma]